MSFVTIAICLVLGAEGAVWPGFLSGDPGTIDAASIPLEWSPQQHVAWQVTLDGYGQSSPVIHGDRLFVTSVKGPMKDECLVTAIAVGDGQTLWQHSIDSSDKVESNTYVSRAAPTPVVDSERVVCFFESGDMVSLSHDGNVQWQRSLSKEGGKFQNRFGLGASLAQHDDLVFVLVDHEGPSYLLAIDKRTGEDRWKAERTSRVSWSSPVLLTLNGRPQLVVSSAGSVDGYDPTTGNLLWTLGGVGGNTAQSPTPVGTDSFLIGASAGSRGESTREAAESNGLVRVVPKDDGFVAEKAWLADKALSTFASPIAYRGLAYWVNRAGVVFCFDVETGEQAFAERIAESCWATPLPIGDRIYFFGKSGQTTVIAAGRDFQQLAVNRLWQPEAEANEQDGQRENFGGRTQYGVAATKDRLFVRTGDVLYCIGK
jgi:outer membrane protein assembly factor BamB